MTTKATITLKPTTMNYDAITFCFIIAGFLLIIWILSQRPKKKTLVDAHINHPKENQVRPPIIPEINPTEIMEDMQKQMGRIANRIQMFYPNLERTIDQVRELQGIIYLLNQKMKEGTRTPDQIRDYETYLLNKQYTNIDYQEIPTIAHNLQRLQNKETNEKEKRGNKK